MELTRRQFMAASCATAAAAALGGCSAIAPTSELSDDQVSALLGAMTTRQKVQQMIVCGLRTWNDGGEDSSDEPLTEVPDQLRVALDAYAYGGAIFFADALGSVDTAAHVVCDVQKALRHASAGAGVPPLLAVDQEGGDVVRLKCASPMPSQMALGATSDDLLATEVATVIGQEVSAVGLNMDFSPVMDINSNPANPVIGTRSFSSNRESVSTMGTAFMQGLAAGGVVACCKHFPGHGNTSTDSHTGLPSLDSTLDDLRAGETVPYRVAIAAGVPAIMTAHIVYPKIEEETVESTSTGEQICLPATMSERILTDFLRGELGFKGVIITDSMVMGAIADHFEPVDAAIRAINAGADILLCPFELTSPQALVSAEDYVNRLVQAVEEGAISIDTINDAVTRILRLKANAGILGANDADGDQVATSAAAIVGSKDNRAIMERAGARAVTLLRNQDHTLPIQLGGDGRALVVYTKADKSKLVDAVRSQLVSRSIVSNANQIDAVACLSSDDIAGVVAKAQGYGNVVVVTELRTSSELDVSTAQGYQYALLDALVADAHGAPAALAPREGEEGQGDEAGTEEGQAQEAQAQPQAPTRRIVHLSANLPYDIACSTQADATLACYGAPRLADPGEGDITAAAGTWAPSLAAALRMAFGENAPVGTLPVTAPSINDKHEYDSQTLYQLGSGIKDWGA